MRKYLYKIDLFCNEYERYDILYENKKYVYIIGGQKIIKVHTFEISDEEHPKKYYTFNKPENFVDNSRYRKNVEKINKKIYYVHYDKNNFHCEKRVALIYDKKYKIYYLKNK